MQYIHSLSSLRNPQDYIQAIKQYVRLPGVPRWRRRYDHLRSRYDSNKFGRQRLLERHHLELMLFEAYRHIQLTGRLPKLRDVVSRAQQDSWVFAGVGMTFHQSLSDDARAKHAGAIKGALRKSYGFEQLRGEYTGAWFLQSFGARVAAADLEGYGSFDFLAEKDGSSLEVECKLLTENFLSSIPSQVFETMSDLIFGEYRALAHSQARSTIARIKFEEDTPRSDPALRTLVDQLAGAIKDGRESLEYPKATIFYEEWPAGDEDPSLIDAMARQLTMMEGRSSIAIPGTNGGLILAMSGSTRLSPSDVRQALRRRLQKARDQMSGTNRGVVFMEVAGPTALQVEADLYAATVGPLIKELLQDLEPIDAVVLGFPGPPFSVGTSHAYLAERAERTPESAIVRDLLKFEEVPMGPAPGADWRKRWWDRKYRSLPRDYWEGLDLPDEMKAFLRASLGHGGTGGE